MTSGVGCGKHRYTLQNVTEVHVLEPQISGAGEVHQDLHNAVEAVDLVADNIHVAARVRIVLLQFVLQQLQVQHDGVDGVLDLVRHASRHPSAGGKAP